MANQKWDLYKGEIERLYIHEDQKLEDVMSFMETQHFKASYTRQLNKWGFRKHSESRNDEWILKRVAKRKRNGKESEVFIDGIQLHPKKIAKAKYGKGFVSTISQYAPSPKTPEGYLVTTPQMTGMCLSWSSSLPWLRFMSFLDSPTEQAPSLPSSSLFVDSSRSSNVTKDTNFELMRRLNSMVPWNKLKHLGNIYSGSRTSAALSILMPETEQGQLDGWSTNLSTLKSGPRDHLTVVLYLISNNLMSPDEDGLFDEQKERDSRLVLRLLKDSGWAGPDQLRILLSTREPTAESIAEKVFESALWIGDSEIFAAQEGNIRLTNLLIKYGADIEHGLANEVGKTALYFAISSEDLAVVRALLLQGAKVTRECARAAMRTCYSYPQALDLVGEIIDIYLEEHLAAGRNDPDLVVPAVESKKAWIVKHFIDRGAKLNGLIAPPYSLRHEGMDICLLGLAVMKGSVDIVRLLTYSTIGANRLSSPPYMYPLTLAAMTGETDIAQILLESGADVRAADEGETTLLEHAARKSNLSLCQMLIMHGAKVDREPCDAQKSPSALMTAIQEDNVLIVELLINSNARLNDRFEAAPGSVLAAALEVGNDAVIDKLIHAGSRYVGVKMEKIGNLQTAILMKEKGVLAGVLCSSDHRILAAAISAGHEDLAHFLLQNGAHKEHDARDPFSTLHSMTPLEAATDTNNMRLIQTRLEHGVAVTEYALTYAIKRHSGLLPVLLRRFSGRAPTAVAAALREPSMAALKLLREANVGFTGAPRPLAIGSRLNMWYQVWEDDVKSVLEMAVDWDAERSHFTFLLEWAAAAGIPWEPELVSRALIRTILSDEHDRLAELMQLDFDLSYDMWLELERCGFNPLQAAVKSQLVWVVREMLMKGADVNHLGDGPRRRTPLQLAVEDGNMEIFNLLLHYGADVNGPAAEEYGATALQIAAIRGFIGIAQRLLDLGADVNAKPAVKDGRTALMGAAEHGRIDMLHLLLDRGALIVGAQRFFFDEAVRLAKSNGHYAAARLLVSFEVSLVATGDFVEDGAEYPAHVARDFDNYTQNWW
ncbi:ankyrin [Aspergillus piperis CBS 112811]|uniref:Ankyrin n=1 Tax=Aspergillus piperis CBS 112811 TaxID=1448313 RepID=A0A8G1R184_9EURO|nr:ankyrin [Aspergillus piperis CBS 112811]RAH56399.1 ankyrin [Aspergillus piperis CBS 112811]